MISRRVLLGVGAAALAPAVVAAADSNVLWDAMAGKAVPGMAALVIRDCRVERELAAGVRRLDSSALVQRGDRWHLGSDGKAMTATMIARLVERGVLSWQTRLDEMLPDLPMHADYRDVTLPDLLSHRSGLPENVGDSDFFATFYEDTAAYPDQRVRYIRRALSEPPAGPKRSERSYSNTGYLVAAAAAEHAADEDFETLMRAHVLRPLRMRSVSFEQIASTGEPAGHVDGRVADRPRDANPRMLAPAGGMSMSLRDWARFCIEHLKGERGRGRLLSAETYRMLHTGQGGTRSALGWGIQASAVGRRGPVLTHSGSDGNWWALVILFPETGNGVLVAANAAESMGGDEASVAVLRALAAGVAEPAPAQ